MFNTISNQVFYTLGLYDIWNMLDNQQKETLTEAINIGINEGLKANPVENRVVLTLEEIENKRDYKTVYLIIATLANLCAATEEKIIDLLTGYLWDEEEAGHIKRSA